ncbi:MAG TPA: hypothetical protein VLJ20_06600 [Acetobacteraceae bacterium]|nr:hypothetical protein [Acetobacteraceae bacterium]
MPAAMPAVPSVIPPLSPASRTSSPSSARRIARLLPTAALLAALAGCGAPLTSTFPPDCPRAGVLADAADLTRYRSAGQEAGASGHDLTDMVLDGQITGVSGDCTRASRRELDVTVAVSMRLTRGPAARGPVDDVPFFVAVTENGKVLDKQIYHVAPGFSANADTVRLTSDAVSLNLPISTDKPGSAYDLVVGFQLTPDEVALNRRRGPR